MNNARLLSSRSTIASITKRAVGEGGQRGGGPHARGNRAGLVRRKLALVDQPPERAAHPGDGFFGGARLCIEQPYDVPRLGGNLRDPAPMAPAPATPIVELEGRAGVVDNFAVRSGPANRTASGRTVNPCPAAAVAIAALPPAR